MSDTSTAAGDGGAAPSGGQQGQPFSLGKFLGPVASGDTGLALGVIGIIIVLILPMPAMVLDLLLAISITFSVLIMMTALFIRTPLEFTAFPTILLIAAMMRLALNLASTRLILSNGHNGEDAAGAVIQAFGHFVMQGNFVIGIIVFAILVIVNFVVITKGSGRIAEVAARFTLDAMPGKQMAIDADLSAGLINEEEAKERRKKLEDESSFFGAMDGASKFVRGDAVAGLIITFINIIGGMIIGVGQNGMPFDQASETYTLLTAGDGLVSQIPALIVSTAAGLLVSKAGVDGAADKALFNQLTFYPKAFGMSAFVMLVLSALPGIPVIPFWLLGGGAAAMAWYSHKQRQKAEAQKVAQKVMAAQSEAEAKPAEQPISESLHMDELRLEIGYSVLPLVNGQGDGDDRLTDQIKALRRQLASDMGFVMPSVRILDNMQLQPNEYVIKVKEVEAGRGVIFPDELMVMDPAGRQVDMPGRHTTEPTFGLAATWIDRTLGEEASLKGYTVVDPVTVLATHLTEILKSNMSDLLSYSEVQGLLENVNDKYKTLVDELIPTQITVTGLQRILQNLLIERISIRDLPTILEGVAEAVSFTQNGQIITEHVRSRLARQISAAHSGPDGYLPLLSLSPEWEHAFAEAIVGGPEEKQLAMAPSKLQEFIEAVRRAFDAAASAGEVPVLLTSPAIRPFVRTIVERFRSQTSVISQNEVHPKAKLRTVGQI